MKHIFTILVLSFLLIGCSTAEKKETYTPSPANIQESKVDDPVQQKIDKRVEEIQEDRANKYRLRSLFGVH